MSEFYNEIVKLTEQVQSKQLDDLLNEKIAFIKNAIKTAASKGHEETFIELPGITLEVKQELANRLVNLKFKSCVKEGTFESQSNLYDSFTYKGDGLYVKWK